MRSYKRITLILLFITLVSLVIYKQKHEGVLSLFSNQVRETKPGSINTTSTYINEKYHFQIITPDQATSRVITDVAGDSIVIHNQNYEVQIFISPFDEGTIITPEKIKQDIPDIQIAQAETLTVDGVRGVAFIDQSRNTREVWFASAGYLYQVTARPENDIQTESIIRNWQWVR